MSDLKRILLSVQESVHNIETRLTQVEKSLVEVKIANRKVVESQVEISENVKELVDRAQWLEAELLSIKEERELLKEQTRCEKCFHGIPEQRDEKWEEAVE